MTEPLAKIEKPEARSFGGGRKLIYVPLVLIAPGSDRALSGLVDLFWQEAAGQVQNLTAGLGKISKISHELVGREENMLEALGEMNSGSLAMVKKLVEGGAVFQVIEEQEILNEFMDWSRCLAMGLLSARAFETVYQNYVKIQQQRNELIAGRIDEALKENEIGLLLLREGHHVQYAADIQVFYVAPPSLDAIHRYLREHYEGRPLKDEQAEPGCAAEAESQAAPGEPEEPTGSE
jgi:hypothetical protein